MRDFSLFNSTNVDGRMPIDLTRPNHTAVDPLSAGTSPLPQVPGEPISPNLKQLCRGLGVELGKVPGRWASLSSADKVLAGIRQSLKKLPGNKQVRTESPKQAYNDVCTALETHRAPVIMLAPSGQPEFVFEWTNGAWHGYDAVTFNRLPEQMSPAKKVQELFLKSHHGMYFSTYRIEGRKDEEPASPLDDALFMQRHDEAVEGADTASQLRRRFSRSSMNDDSTNLRDDEAEEVASLVEGGAPSEVSEVGEERDHHV